MKKIFAFATLFLLLPLLVSRGQTPSKPLNYRAKYDSLSLLKTKLLNEKLKLKKEIEALTNFKEKLDTLLEKCRPIIYIKKYGKRIGSRIAMRRIWKGMTKGMLKDSWGKPDKITSKKYSYGKFTQYYYGRIIFFFRNGRLIDWQERKH